MKKVIDNCTATVYQRHMEVMSLYDVRLVMEIAPIVPAPLIQPQNEFCEVSGKIKDIKNYSFDESGKFFILFISENKDKFQGYFYKKPTCDYDEKGRLYFELTGALTIKQ